MNAFAPYPVTARFAGAALLLLIASVASMVYAADDDLLIIAASGMNTRPAIAWNSADDTFLVTWISLPTATKWFRAEIDAALISTNGALSAGERIAISRPSGKKIYAPYVAAAWHEETRQFVVLFHESLDSSGSLVLTSLGADGTVLKRGVPVAEAPGALLSAPVVWRSSATTLAAVWGELAETGFRSRLLLIDPVKPNTSTYAPFDIALSSTLIEIPMAVSSAGEDAAVIYGLINNTGNGSNRSLYARRVSPLISAADSRTVATSRKVSTSQTVSAATGEDGDLVIYDKHVAKKGIDALASFTFSPGDGRVGNPPEFTGAGAQSFEGVVLAPAADGRHRAISVNRSEQNWSILLHTLSADGTLEGEPLTIYTSKRPLSSPAAAWGHARQTLLIAWSEDTPAGAMRLVAAQVPIP